MMKTCDRFVSAEPRTAPAPTSRRHFLAVLSSSAAGAFVAGCSSASGGVAPKAFGDVSAGLVADLPVGTIKIIAGSPAAVGRDGGGIYALTTTCTHNGCDVSVNGSGANQFFHCFCHGSDYDKNGSVTQGPAEAPLVHFKVDIDPAGNITVHGGTQVDASVRVAVG